jgi:hypothetical protein
MILKIHKKTLQTEFIDNAIDFCGGKNKAKIPVIIDGDMLYTYALSECRNNAFYQSIQVEVTDPIPRFNIEVTKLQQGIACIRNDQEFITFNVTKQTLSYNDGHTSFKIRLDEDELVPLPKFNPSSLLTHTSFIYEFDVDKALMTDIKKCEAFASESLKFYLAKENNDLYMIFGDKVQSHLDQIKILLRSDVTEDIPEMIYRSSFLKHLVKMKTFPVTVKILSNKSLMIVPESTNTKTLYITTKLTQ